MGLRHKTKVAKAFGQFGAMAIDPSTYYEVGKRYAEGKGATLPGSRYIGPFNPLPPKGANLSRGKWAPKSKADMSALIHDTDYSRYIKEGYKPSDVYHGFSKADQDMIDRAKKDLTSKHSVAELLGMEAKKQISKTGLTSSKIGF